MLLFLLYIKLKKKIFVSCSLTRNDDEKKKTNRV